MLPKFLVLAMTRAVFCMHAKRAAQLVLSRSDATMATTKSNVRALLSDRTRVPLYCVCLLLGDPAKHIQMVRGHICRFVRNIGNVALKRATWNVETCYSNRAARAASFLDAVAVQAWKRAPTGCPSYALLLFDGTHLTDSFDTPSRNCRVFFGFRCHGFS